MRGVPADLDTTRGPPTALVVRHVLVALGCLLAAALVAVADAVGVATPAASRRHLLLAGWVCLTILGAATQFVPVWSGRPLHSRRLARLQLWLAGTGVVGLAVTLHAAPRLVPVAGALLVAGLWTFVYNVGRTLPTRGLDATERRFALALAGFLLVTVAGGTLALGYRMALPVPRSGLVAAHVTLALYGAVLPTVFGALYQLVPMFTSTELDALDRGLRRVEGVALPVGVAALAVGRLLRLVSLARVGAGLLLVAIGAFAVVLARLLARSRTDPSPTLVRYGVAAVALPAWLLLTAPGWLTSPLAADPFGASEALLVLGVVGAVVVGSLYHVVPFLVWEAEYADRLGLEPVPTLEELYDERLARADLAALVGGTVLLTATDRLALPAVVRAAGACCLGLAAALVVANCLRVLAHGDGRARRLVAAVAG